jgi:hypothetical protein
MKPHQTGSITLFQINKRVGVALGGVGINDLLRGIGRTFDMYFACWCGSANPYGLTECANL